MKGSIRYKYTLVFAAVITIILFSIWCMNNLFLEKYYIRNKENILKTSYEQIDQMLKENSDAKIDVFNKEEDEAAPEAAGAAFLRGLGEKYNISIFMIDKRTGGYLSTEPRNGRIIEMRMKELYPAKNKAEERPERPQPPGERIELLSGTEQYAIQKVYNDHLKSSYLQSHGHFSDPNISFLMSLPLASVQESVALSNRFLTIISLAALLLGSIAVFVTTRKVAAPILTLSKLSEQMADLNFNVKYVGDSSDEIGVLGNSMNALSDRLKDTMGELQSANEKLKSDIEQKIKIDEMRKDFVSNVSHELKTPITIIHGYAEGLADGMCKDEESRDFYYQVILNESDKMTVLVKQLLNLSDLEFGFDLPEYESFDLTALISDILTSSQVLLKEKKANVEFLLEKPVLVWADEFKIEEVLHNYLSNALNHLDGEHKIVIRIEEEEELVKVFVYNTGAPIPQKDLESLWTKFYKVDKARTRQYGGSGIGLSIVKAIMDSHHQSCGVENQVGGVEFWFSLEKEKGQTEC